MPRAACSAEADPGLTALTIPHGTPERNTYLYTCGAVMSSDLPEWFIRAFTMPRLAPYLTAAETDGVPADAFYVWALQVAEALYCPLHCLELCLRNALHRQLSEFYSRVDWWTIAPLGPSAFRKIDKARQQAIRPDRANPGPGDTITELSFGSGPPCSTAAMIVTSGSPPCTKLFLTTEAGANPCATISKQWFCSGTGSCTTSQSITETLGLIMPRPTAS